MTKQDCLSMIEIAVPSDQANKDKIANLALSKAISKLGNMKNTPWNRKRKSINLTASKGEYDVGVDILGDSKDGWDISEIWVEDTQSWKVEIVDSEFFNSFKRGGTDSGRPIYATYRTADRLLEFFPTPDSAYSVWMEYRKDINNFEDVPKIYHPALVDYAILCVKALFDSNMALQLSAESKKDMEEDSLMIWNGSRIDMNTVSISGGVSLPDADSGNLRSSW